LKIKRGHGMTYEDTMSKQPEITSYDDCLYDYFFYLINLNEKKNRAWNDL